MRRGRSALRTAGVCLSLALCFAALNAATASANWKVGGAEIKEGAEIPVALTVHLNTKFLIRIPIGIGTIVIHCERLLFHAKLAFPRVWRSRWLIDINCRILFGETELPCELEESVEAATKGELFLHEGKTYLRVEPETGGVFMTLNFTGAECSLPEEFPISGKVVLEDTSLEKEQVEHVFVPNNKGLFADKLKTAGGEVQIEAEMGVKLGEAFEGKAWSGVA